MPRYPYIAVEGVIGVGKTTLVRMLCQDFNAEPLLEVFEENPFLSDFYSDRARYAFQTEVFFVLSRYRQQHDVIPRALERGPLISDYTFAKSALFAGLNLGGDEHSVYGKLHSALSEKIPRPDLLVYLRARLDTLMARIAARDRPYERGMERGYIDRLRLAYDGFVAAYSESPVLVIDTDDLNIVQEPEALSFIRQRIRAALQHGTFQQALPNVPITLTDAERSELAARPAQPLMHADARRDTIHQFLALTQSVGELGATLSDSGGEAALGEALSRCFNDLARVAGAAGLEPNRASPPHTH